jgi:hypothetical protein
MSDNPNKGIDGHFFGLYAAASIGPAATFSELRAASQASTGLASAYRAYYDTQAWGFHQSPLWTFGGTSSLLQTGGTTTKLLLSDAPNGLCGIWQMHNDELEDPGYTWPGGSSKRYVYIYSPTYLYRRTTYVHPAAGTIVYPRSGASAMRLCKTDQTWRSQSLGKHAFGLDITFDNLSYYGWSLNHLRVVIPGGWMNSYRRSCLLSSYRGSPGSVTVQLDYSPTAGGISVALNTSIPLWSYTGTWLDGTLEYSWANGTGQCVIQPLLQWRSDYAINPVREYTE